MSGIWQKKESLDETISTNTTMTIIPLTIDVIIHFPRKSINSKSKTFDYNKRGTLTFSLFIKMVHKKFAAFAIFSLTTFVMLVIYMNFDKHFVVERNEKMKLFPPNPEVPLPPSSVNLRRFKNAAINSDSEECSSIGR